MKRKGGFFACLASVDRYSIDNVECAGCFSGNTKFHKWGATSTLKDLQARIC
jgi:hypothetical protein